jgi:hypothetical protein
MRLVASELEDHALEEIAKENYVLITTAMARMATLCGTSANRDKHNQILLRNMGAHEQV